MTKEAIPSEHYEQARLVQWFRRAYPGTRIFAIPNGGERSITTAARLKVEGVVAGVPDLFVPGWRVWVEMKRIKGGKVSKEQADWMEYLSESGYTCIVGHGFEDAKAKLLTHIEAV